MFDIAGGIYIAAIVLGVPLALISLSEMARRDDNYGFAQICILLAVVIFAAGTWFIFWGHKFLSALR